MKRWSRYAFIVLFLLVLVAGLGVLLISKDRSVSREEQLVIRYTEGELQWVDVMYLGTNAIAHLEHQIEVKSTPFSEFYRWIWPYLPYKIEQELGTPTKPDQIRIRAINGLAQLGPDASRATPILIDCLRDPVQEVRRRAVITLMTICREPSKVIPAIKSSVEKPVDSYDIVWKMAQRGGKMVSNRTVKPHPKDFEYRNTVASILPELSHDERPYAVDLCLGNLEDKRASLENRIQSMLVLVSLDLDLAKKHVDESLKILRESNLDLHAVGLDDLIFDLGRLTPESKGAASDVLQLIEDIYQDASLQSLCMNAVGALGKIDPSLQGIPDVMIKLSTHQNKHVRHNAVFCLKNLDLPADKVLPALAPFVDDEDNPVQIAAAGLLWKLDPDRTQEALRILEDLFFQELNNEFNLRAVLWELSDFGPLGNGLMPEMRNLLKKEKNALTAVYLAGTILNVSETGDPEALQMIKSFQNHETISVRNRAKDFLDKFEER